MFGTTALRSIRVLYQWPQAFVTGLVQKTGCPPCLFLQTDESFSAGERVRLEVILGRAPNAVWLDAQVLWLRTARGADRRQPAGVSLEIAAEHEARVEFLTRLAHGQVFRGLTTRQRRIPVELPATLRVGNGRITTTQAVVRDLSHGGVCVEAAGQLPGSPEWKIAMSSPFDAKPIEAPLTVRWRSRNGRRAGAMFAEKASPLRFALVRLIRMIERDLAPLTLLQGATSAI